MSWLRHGFWNTLEHALTRIADAATSLLLLWALDPELFSRLALAQAWVAPVLLLFVSPENVLYRDYAQWKAQGPSDLAARLRALRLFGWGKAQLALVLSAVLALAFPMEAAGLPVAGLLTGGFWEGRFAIFIWAFSLALGPQISGPDREYLRLDLQLRALNFLTLLQKGLLLAGTAWVALASEGSPIARLALVAALSAIAPAILARAWVVRSLRRAGASEAALAGRAGPSAMATLSEAIGTFSLWQHLCGVVLNWIQTLDLLVLGWFRVPARELGLYAAVLKLAGFSNAAPLALSNLFSVWVGRRVAEAHGIQRELQWIRRYTGALFAGAVVQAGVLIALAPWIFGLLSRERWSAEEIQSMVRWFGWVLSGLVFYQTSLLLGSWLSVRSEIRVFFLRVFLPWFCVAGLIYVLARGSVEWVAQGNAAVGAAYLLLLVVYFRRNRYS